MPAKKLNKKNCCFLYGEDLVSLALRREGLLKAYFEGDRRIPFCSMEREVWKSMRMPWQGSHFFPVRRRS